MIHIWCKTHLVSRATWSISERGGFHVTREMANFNYEEPKQAAYMYHDRNMTRLIDRVSGTTAGHTSLIRVAPCSPGIGQILVEIPLVACVLAKETRLEC